MKALIHRTHIASQKKRLPGMCLSAHKPTKKSVIKSQRSSFSSPLSAWNRGPQIKRTSKETRVSWVLFSVVQWAQTAPGKCFTIPVQGGSECDSGKDWHPCGQTNRFLRILRLRSFQVRGYTGVWLIHRLKKCILWKRWWFISEALCYNMLQLCKWHSSVKNLESQSPWKLVTSTKY